MPQTTKETGADAPVRSFGGNGRATWGAKLVHTAKQKAKQLKKEAGDAYDKRKAALEAAKAKREEEQALKEEMKKALEEETALAASLDQSHAESTSPDDSGHERTPSTSPTKGPRWKKIRQFTAEKKAAAIAWKSEKEGAFKALQAWKKGPSEATRASVRSMLTEGALYSPIHKLVGSRFLDEKTIRGIYLQPIQEPEDPADTLLRHQIYETAMWQQFIVWFDKRLCFNEVYAGDLELYLKDKKLLSHQDKRLADGFKCPDPLLPHHEEAFLKAMAATFKRDLDALRNDREPNGHGIYGIYVRDAFNAAIGLSPALDELIFNAINKAEYLPIITLGCARKLRQAIESRLAAELGVEVRKLQSTLASKSKEHNGLLQQSEVTWRVLINGIAASEKIIAPFKKVPIFKALSYGNVFSNYDFLGKHQEMLDYKQRFEQSAGKSEAKKSNLIVKLQTAIGTLQQAEIACDDATLESDLSAFKPTQILQTSDEGLLFVEAPIAQALRALEARVKTVEERANSVGKAVKKQNKLTDTYQSSLYTQHVLFNGVQQRADELLCPVTGMDELKATYLELQETLSQPTAVLTEVDMAANLQALQTALDAFTAQVTEARKLQTAIDGRSFELKARARPCFGFTLAIKHCGYTSLSMDQLRTIAKWHEDTDTFDIEAYQGLVQNFILESPRAISLKQKYDGWGEALTTSRDAHEEGSSTYKVHTDYIKKCRNAVEPAHLVSYIAAKTTLDQQFSKRQERHAKALEEAEAEDRAVAQATQNKAEALLAVVEATGLAAHQRMTQLMGTDNRRNQMAEGLLERAISSAQAEMNKETEKRRRLAEEAAQRDRELTEGLAKELSDLEDNARSVTAMLEALSTPPVAAVEMERSMNGASDGLTTEHQAAAPQSDHELNDRLAHELGVLEEHATPVRDMIAALSTPPVAAPALHEAADGAGDATPPAEDQTDDGNNHRDIAPKDGDGGTDAIWASIIAGNPEGANPGASSPEATGRNDQPHDPTPIKWWHFFSRFMRWLKSLFTTPKTDQPIASEQAPIPTREWKRITDADSQFQGYALTARSALNDTTALPGPGSTTL